MRVSARCIEDADGRFAPLPPGTSAEPIAADARFWDAAGGAASGSILGVGRAVGGLPQTSQ